MKKVMSVMFIVLMFAASATADIIGLPSYATIAPCREHPENLNLLNVVYYPDATNRYWFVIDRTPVIIGDDSRLHVVSIDEPVVDAFNVPSGGAEYTFKTRAELPANPLEGGSMQAAAFTLARAKADELPADEVQYWPSQYLGVYRAFVMYPTSDGAEKYDLPGYFVKIDKAYKQVYPEDNYSKFTYTELGVKKTVKAVKAWGETTW